MMAPAYKKKEPKKPNVQMRQLHWAKLPDAKIKGTLWEKEVGDEDVTLKVDELELLFAAAAKKEAKETTEEEAKERETETGEPQET